MIDGDTIRSDEERIRLEGIDAAEIGHAKCEAERRLAILAKHRLEQLLGSGSVDIRRNAHPDPPDRYGRTLARVLVDGEDVACVLIKEGYARPWIGHREDWCMHIAGRAQAGCRDAVLRRYLLNRIQAA